MVSLYTSPVELGCGSSHSSSRVSVACMSSAIEGEEVTVDSCIEKLAIGDYDAWAFSYIPSLWQISDFGMV